MKRRILSALLLSVFFLFLFYRNAVISGALEGLVLWYLYVLPTLLPIYDPDTDDDADRHCVSCQPD